MVTLNQVLELHQSEFKQVVDFNPAKDKLCRFDFTAANQEIDEAIFKDTATFSNYINHKLQTSGAKFGIGGYNESRTLYRRSELFNGDEPRTIHLGVDIWGAAGTSVYTPLGGSVHSFAYNNSFGDYGATIILQHQLDAIIFYTLYGHLSHANLLHLKEGKYISRGELLGQFGQPEENGNWPPHLHFQVIRDMRIRKGDYPGVCAASERESYLSNCPDPDLILNMIRHAG